MATLLVPSQISQHGAPFPASGTASCSCLTPRLRVSFDASADVSASWRLARSPASFSHGAKSFSLGTAKQPLTPRTPASPYVADGTQTMQGTPMAQFHMGVLVADGLQTGNPSDFGFSPKLRRASAKVDGSRGSRTCILGRLSLQSPDSTSPYQLRVEPNSGPQTSLPQELSVVVPETVPENEAVGESVSRPMRDGSKTWSMGDNFSKQRLGRSSAPAAVSVIAPGGGTVFNAPVYAALGQRPDMRVDILGKTRAPYDRYPASWADGAPAPNLETFASDLIRQGVLEKSTCLVFGSRGGQVVLPAFWQARGADVPPAVVLNGGCAMKLPGAVHWPQDAVTFLLLGGQDYFRYSFSPSQYIADARSRVPSASSTTAILLVNEMAHMPQTELLNAIMHLMISVVTTWKLSARAVRSDLDTMLKALVALGMSGQLHYTASSGCWEEFSFSRGGVARN